MRLTDEKPELVEACRYIPDCMKMLNAGAAASLPLWHLKRLQRLVPEDSDISQAAYLLEQCVRYRHV